MAKKNKRKAPEGAGSIESEKSPTARKKNNPCNDQKQGIEENGKPCANVKGKGLPSSAFKNETKGKSSGIDEIDSLFATKKERDADQKHKEAEEEKRQMEQLKLFRQNAKSSSLPSSANHAKNKSLAHDRTDVAGMKANEWVNDGLGGVFDVDGFTGRKEDGCKVYKAHLFNKKGFGSTKDCPFDCDCCYI